MRRPIGGAIAPANADLMVEQTVISVGPRRRSIDAHATTRNKVGPTRATTSAWSSELPADGKFRMLDKPETNELDRLDRFAAGGDAGAWGRTGCARGG